MSGPRGLFNLLHKRPLLLYNPLPRHLPIHHSLVKAGTSQGKGIRGGSIVKGLEAMLSAAPLACPLLATSSSRPSGLPLLPWVAGGFTKWTRRTWEEGVGYSMLAV